MDLGEFFVWVFIIGVIILGFIDGWIHSDDDDDDDHHHNPKRFVAREGGYNPFGKELFTVYEE